MLLGEVAAHCPCDLAGVPSHCGVGRNEHVGQLAKQALRIPLAAQIKAPVDYADARQRLKMSTPARTILEQIPKSLVEEVSSRQAEVILAQFFTGHTSMLHPVRTYLDETNNYCLHKCKPRVLNDVDHFVLRCPARASSRREALPALRDRLGITVADLVQKWPEQVLAFLGNEGLL